MTKADELVALIDASDSSDLDNVVKTTETVKLITDLACSSAEAQAILGKALVLQYLIDVAFYHAASNEQLVTNALSAWIHLCRREILNKQTLNQDNLSLSEKHFTSLLELAQITGANAVFAGQYCTLVMILASDSPKRQVALGQLGFARVIVTILQIHLQNANVIEMGLRAVRNVSIHDANGALFMESGMGHVLIYILKLVIKGDFQANILEAVLYAVINLCDDEGTAQQLGQLGILELMLTILPTILQDGDLCNVCCAAFRNLLIVADNIKRVLSTSICELLMEVLRLHKGDSDTADATIWALANLAGDRLIRHRLAVELQVMPLLRDVFLCGVDNYPEDTELGPVAQGTSFLIYILSYDPIEDKNSNESNQEVVITPQLSQTLAQDGAGELLSMFLHRYRTREAMVESCHRAIITLTRGGGSIVKNALATHKVVDGITLTLREHVQVLETTVFGLSALLQIISDDDKDINGENGNLLQLREHAAALPEVLRMVLVEHRKHDEVASSVVQLMLLLQSNEIDRVQLVNALSAAGVLKENSARIVDGKVDVDKVDVLRASYNLPAICTVLGMSTADLPAPPAENEGDEDEAGGGEQADMEEEEEEEDSEETQRLKQQVLAKLFGGGAGDGDNLSMEDAEGDGDDAEE